MSSLQPGPSATAEQPLGGDRELALQHMPARARDAFEALFGLDAAMGDVVARATEPTLGRIKLAWWREALERLDTAPPPAEPRLQAIAAHLLALGIKGAELGELEPGWGTLLDAEPDLDLLAGRGTILFRLGGRILQADDPALGDAGALYALAFVARRGMPALFDAAERWAKRIAGKRFPRPLRSLTGLARLAARDCDRRLPPEPEGSAGRAAAMLRHRWSGIVVPRR